MDKFKFPDEEDEFEIEVEDDTPQDDQGREPMPEDIVKSLDAELKKRLPEKTKRHYQLLNGC